MRAASLVVLLLSASCWAKGFERSSAVLFTVGYDPPALHAQVWRRDTLNVPGIVAHSPVWVYEIDPEIPQPLGGCWIIDTAAENDGQVIVRWVNADPLYSCDPAWALWTFMQLH